MSCRILNVFRGEYTENIQPVCIPEQIADQPGLRIRDLYLQTVVPGNGLHDPPAAVRIQVGKHIRILENPDGKSRMIHTPAVKKCAVLPQLFEPPDVVEHRCDPGKTGQIRLRLVQTFQFQEGIHVAQHTQGMDALEPVPGVFVTESLCIAQKRPGPSPHIILAVHSFPGDHSAWASRRYCPDSMTYSIAFSRISWICCSVTGLMTLAGDPRTREPSGMTAF